MKPIASVDLIGNRSMPGVGMPLLALAVAALAWQSWLAWSGQAAFEQQREAFAVTLRQAAVPRPPVAPEEQRTQLQMEHLARHLAAPWNELMALFEKHGAGDVALVSLEPDATTGIVTLTARARHRRAMLAYVMALEKDVRLSSVLLDRHETLHEVEGTPVQFSLHAVWRPAVAQQAAQAARTPRGNAQEVAQ
jgi:hypothetical protein